MSSKRGKTRQVGGGHGAIRGEVEVEAGCRRNLGAGKPGYLRDDSYLRSLTAFFFSSVYFLLSSSSQLPSDLYYDSTGSFQRHRVPCRSPIIGRFRPADDKVALLSRGVPGCQPTKTIILRTYFYALQLTSSGVELCNIYMISRNAKLFGHDQKQNVKTTRPKPEMKSKNFCILSTFSPGYIESLRHSIVSHELKPFPVSK